MPEDYVNDSSLAYKVVHLLPLTHDIVQLDPLLKPAMPSPSHVHALYIVKYVRFGYIIAVYTG